MNYEPAPTADTVILTLDQWDRLYRGLGRGHTLEAPADHPLTKAGYATVWCSQIGAWARVSSSMPDAILAWEGANERLLVCAIAEAESLPGTPAAHLARGESVMIQAALRILLDRKVLG